MLERSWASFTAGGNAVNCWDAWSLRVRLERFCRDAPDNMLMAVSRSPHVRFRPSHPAVPEVEDSEGNAFNHFVTIHCIHPSAPSTYAEQEPGSVLSAVLDRQSNVARNRPSYLLLRYSVKAFDK